MKRYLLFAGQDFYPKGGFADFVDSYDSVGKAVEFGNLLVNQVGVNDPDWYHVIDGETGDIEHRVE